MDTKYKIRDLLDNPAFFGEVMSKLHYRLEYATRLTTMNEVAKGGYQRIPGTSECPECNEIITSMGLKGLEDSINSIMQNILMEVQKDSIQLKKNLSAQRTLARLERILTQVVKAQSANLPPSKLISEVNKLATQLRILSPKTGLRKCPKCSGTGVLYYTPHSGTWEHMYEYLEYRAMAGNKNTSDAALIKELRKSIVKLEGYSEHNNLTSPKHIADTIEYLAMSSAGELGVDRIVDLSNDTLRQKLINELMSNIKSGIRVGKERKGHQHMRDVMQYDEEIDWDSSTDASLAISHISIFPSVSGGDEYTGYKDSYNYVYRFMNMPKFRKWRNYLPIKDKAGGTVRDLDIQNIVINTIKNFRGFSSLDDGELKKVLKKIYFMGYNVYGEKLNG